MIYVPLCNEKIIIVISIYAISSCIAFLIIHAFNENRERTFAALICYKDIRCRKHREKIPFLCGVRTQYDIPSILDTLNIWLWIEIFSQYFKLNLAFAHAELQLAGVAKPGQRRRSLVKRVWGLEWARKREGLTPITLFLRDSWVQIPPPALYYMHKVHSLNKW